MSQPQISHAALSQAMQSLELLSRKCFVLAGTCRSAGSFSIDNLHVQVRDLLTAHLGSLVDNYLGNHGNHHVPESRHAARVFLATNYRRIRGSLQRPQPTDPSDFAQYAAYYGSLADGAQLLDPRQERFFMPVAFWSHRLYEHEMPWGEADSQKLTISGFSRWSADNGFLSHRGRPILGFHFSFDRIARGFSDGFVGIRFSRHIHGATALSVTDQFLEQMWKDGCRFQTDEGVDRPDLPAFPVIEGDRDEMDRALSRALFSIFFNSNFPETNRSARGWIGELRTLIEGLRDGDSIRMKAREGLSAYAMALDAVSRSKARLLAFRHYYALLMNPGLSFETKVTGYKAPLGTLNLYTNIELPTILVAEIRKHLEGIFHLLRGLEEWDEAKLTGSRQASSNFAHELKRLPRNLANLVVRQTDRVAGRPLFSIEQEPLGSYTNEGPIYARLILRTLPVAGSHISRHIGLCFFPEGVTDTANLIALWCQSDSLLDLTRLLGETEVGKLSLGDMINQLWDVSLRLTPLATEPMFLFASDPPDRRTRDGTPALAKEYARLSNFAWLASRMGLRLNVVETTASRLHLRYIAKDQIAWLGRAILAILRDYALWAPQPCVVDVTLSVDQSTNRYTLYIESIPSFAFDCSPEEKSAFNDFRAEARRSQPGQLRGRGRSRHMELPYHTSNVAQFCLGSAGLEGSVVRMPPAETDAGRVDWRLTFNLREETPA